MVNTSLSSLKRFFLLLFLGIPLLSINQAQAATDKYVVQKLRGYLSFSAVSSSWMEIVPAAQSAIGNFQGGPAINVLQIVHPALVGKLANFTLGGALSFTPAVISGNVITQAFTSEGWFLMTSTEFPGAMLSGSIIGGTIAGQLGSSSDVEVLLTVRNLASDIVALATDTTILKLSASSTSPLSATCFGAQEQCTAQNSYLSSFDLASAAAWSVPDSALASAVPESQTSLMFALGAALMAFRSAVRSTTRQRSLH